MPKKVTTKKDHNKVLESMVSSLLGLMGINASFTVSEDKENDAFLVNLEAGEEAGLIIGNRGRTLNSIQTLLGIMFKRATGEWRRIIVDVSNWREREKERLIQLAAAAAERMKTTGEPQSLYNLTPTQRRIVHMYLAQDKDVQTHSQGEGKDRYLVIGPKK